MRWTQVQEKWRLSCSPTVAQISHVHCTAAGYTWNAAQLAISDTFKAVPQIPTLSFVWSYSSLIALLHISLAWLGDRRLILCSLPFTVDHFSFGYGRFSADQPFSMHNPVCRGHHCLFKFILCLRCRSSWPVLGWRLLLTKVRLYL